MTKQTPNSVKGDRNNNDKNTMPPEGQDPGGSFHIREELNMIYVMSDIHGREDRFNAILAQIHLKKTDHLYILGDVIDRNPDGIRLLRRIARSKNMSMLLGNHEYMMLDALDHPDDQDKGYLWRWVNGGDETWDKWKYCSKAFQKEMLDYLRSLPINIEVSCGGKDWLLVHGGPEEKMRKKYGNESETLIRYKSVWHRISLFEEMPEGKTVVFGHTPTMRYQQKEPMEVFYGDNIIGIDCGCAYVNGRLACMRLDDGAVYYSEEE